MQKKSFVLLLVFVFSGLLFHNGCKTAEEVYDIRGTWTINLWLPGMSFAMTWKITFAGTETSGTATDTYPGGPGTGTYTVNNNQVTFIMNYSGDVITFTGSFTTENDMSGTWVTGSDTGIWDANR